ncbi:hypothetical protein Cyast_2681 [Cyanobacterium stanieri PCC 7202]|uniref:Uncharacterized protein n=1 Tax=Cyanobacterium stanieri (strain ATCC 29140 / PCC 7202) TaxID=292563 RepID=K9YP09_CYASC|nr:hypothetical protein Cyast_2681 [Cyanobacterium stanieri PCC 7202]
MFKKIKAILTQDIFSADDNTSSDSSIKQNVPESSVIAHNQLFSEIKILSSIAKTLNSESFTQSDFKFFLDIRASFARNIDQYQGLENSAELLRVAIAAQSIFLKIEQTELRYRSSKQQEYYDYVLQILTEEFAEVKTEEEENGILIAQKKAPPKKQYSPVLFKEKLRSKLEEIRATIKSEAGQNALDDYAESVEKLATEKDIGLRLLYLFKKSDIKDLSILRVLSDMVDYLQSKDLKKTSAVIDLVRKNQEIFVQVTRIIGLPKSKETLENYALILQYLGLSKKHEQSAEQFFRLMAVMQEWFNLYTMIENHRLKYPAQEYNLPPEYTKDIPAVEIYKKYENMITIFGKQQ